MLTWQAILGRFGIHRLVGASSVLLLVALSALGTALGVPAKVLGIAWAAFLAMALAIPVGSRAGRAGHARRLVWGYGLASGAMVTSAAVFLVPGAIDHHSAFGGFGIAAGVVIGYSIHTVGHWLTHVDTGIEHTAIRLTAHALAAGAVIGVVYAGMPDLGPLLGLAIISHKAPAGYASAQRLSSDGQPVTTLLLPATGVGLAAIPAALVPLPASPVAYALVFGFAAGIFLHLAMDFLPRCQVGGEIYQLAALEKRSAHSLLDRLRFHAVASTSLGGIAVFVAWLTV